MLLCPGLRRLLGIKNYAPIWRNGGKTGKRSLARAKRAQLCYDLPARLVYCYFLFIFLG